MELKRFMRISAVAVAVAFAPAVVSAETLKDALRSAYEHSGLLQQNRALLRAADEDVAQGVAQLKPVVEWAAQYQLSHATGRGNTSADASLSVTASWLLYDFGRTALRTEALKETVLATRQSLIAVEQDVLLQTVTSYMNLRRASDTERLRASNVELIQEELRAAQDRFEVGEVTRTDVALAEARLASARSQLASATGDRVRQAAAFERVVGRKPGNLAAPRGLPRIPASVAKALPLGRKNHPNIVQVQHQINAAELRLKAAELSAMPTVSLRAGATVNDTPGAGLVGNVTLNAGGPIYSGGALASQTRAAMAQRDATRAQLHSTRHQIDQSVQNAYVLLDVARASGAASERQIRASTVAFRGVREEATLGARTTLDVLNAEQELLDARTGRISAAVDEQVAAYTVLASLGQLTAKSLDLGVKLYDPTEYYNLVKDAPAARSAQGKALDRVMKSIGQ